MKEAYKGLSPEEKRAARESIKNALKERKETRNRVVEKVKMEHLEVRKLRLEKRLMKIPADKRAKVKERIDKAVNTLNRVENRLKEKIKATRQGKLQTVSSAGGG